MDRISQFVTNLDDDVFCIHGLPEEVIATLFAYYSRNSKSLRYTLASMLDETNYISNEGINQSFNIANEKARAFHEKYVLGFGHNSVAEHAVIHVAVENCSILAAKIFEDPRLASYLEKSTRYILFSSSAITKASTANVPTEFADKFEQAQRSCLADYHELTQIVVEHLKSTYKQPDNKSEKAWSTMVNTRAFDLCRGLLPAGALTNVGMTINALELARSLQKWSISDLAEIKTFTNKIRDNAKIEIPTLLKYSTNPGTRTTVRSNLDKLLTSNGVKNYDKPLWVRTYPIGHVELMEAPDTKVAYSTLVSSILKEVYGYDSRPKCTPEFMADMIRTYIEPHTMHSQPGRALETVHFCFRIIMDFGAWRDLQRHRLLTQLNFPRIGCDLGYYIPPEMKDKIKLFENYTRALDRAYDRWRMFPDEPWRQYVVPLAYNVNWEIEGSLREFFYLCERRSGQECHPSYRYVAQEISRQIINVLPVLKGIWNIDLDEYEFAREVTK